MPAHSTSKQGRRLTTAGLITLSAASLLMMAWAIFPTAAFATVPWTGNGVTDGQFNNTDCGVDPSPHIFWIFTGDRGQGLTDVTLTVNGQQFDMDQAGGPSSSWQATTPFFNLSTITASVDGVNGILTISHGCPDKSSTTTSTTTGTTTTGTTTTGTTTTGTTTTGTTTTGTTTTGTTTTGTTTTGTTTTGTTTTGTTTSSTPGSSTTSTTGTTTTDTDTVSPTTVTPTSTTPDQVSPTTVTPGGTAFTGVENVVPLGAIALFLATGGTGLLWAGARRRRDDSENEE